MRLAILVSGIFIAEAISGEQLPWPILILLGVYAVADTIEFMMAYIDVRKQGKVEY